MTMSSWQPYNRGRSIGVKGSEGSKIIRDEEHPLGACMTIKQGQDYVSVSCTISGKIDHTRFFKDMTAAEREYATMEKELAMVIGAVSSAKAADIKVWEAISGFVARFP
jgi:hypothetical protein